MTFSSYTIRYELIESTLETTYRDNLYQLISRLISQLISTYRTQLDIYKPNPVALQVLKYLSSLRLLKH
jgi:hypothetical protein